MDGQDSGGGGIFIPYDKLLQQQSEKLDKILEELRSIDRRKLDVGVFDSFRSSYEQRHDALRTRVEEKIAWAEGLMPLRDKLIQEHNEMRKDVGILKGSEAVWKTRWASLAALVVLVTPVATALFIHYV